LGCEKLISIDGRTIFRGIKRFSVFLFISGVEDTIPQNQITKIPSMKNSDMDLLVKVARIATLTRIT